MNFLLFPAVAESDCVKVSVVGSLTTETERTSDGLADQPAHGVRGSPLGWSASRFSDVLKNSEFAANGERNCEMLCPWTKVFPAFPRTLKKAGDSPPHPVALGQESLPFGSSRSGDFVRSKVHVR